MIVVSQGDRGGGWGAVVVGADAVLVQDGADLFAAEAVGPFGWAQPVGVEGVGDLAGGMPGGA
jgi:hypothetical protein